MNYSQKNVRIILRYSLYFSAVTGGAWQNLHINFAGILMGLTAGLSFALLTIISKPITNQYHPYTIVFYSIGFDLLFYLPFSDLLVIFQKEYELIIWLYAGLMSIISTIFPYLFIIY